MKLDQRLPDDEAGHFINPLVHMSQFLQLGHCREHEPQKGVNFESLPNELLQIIFILLSIRDKMSLRIVNRRFYSVCSDPHLWKNVFIDDAFHVTNVLSTKLAVQTCC